MMGRCLSSAWDVTFSVSVAPEEEGIMEHRPIPNTDLRVSTLCLGTMTFGTPVGEPDAVRLTHWAIDHGVNFIDTANMYEGYTRTIGSPGGVAEAILGKALVDRRDRVVLATKVGMKVGTAPEDSGTSPVAIRRQLDRSLVRLATDIIDIYYLHAPDLQTPLGDILGAIQEGIDAGKIRHYGVSNYSAEQLAELLAVADACGLPRPVIHQPPYSLLKRGIESELLPLCVKEQIAVAPYQVLQAGLLTGKYRRGQPPPEGSRKAEHSAWVGDLTDAFFDRLEGEEAEASSRGQTILEYALGWTLEHPGVVSAVVGVKRIEQLAEMMATVP
jgi:aryl-alcohol dehydrogenase-like predicted oxidoreductase